MAFNRVVQFNGPFNQGLRHDGLRYKLKSYGISGCMGSLRKSIQLMLELLKVPFLLLNFSYYRLMSPFLITLSAMTMILHSTRKCAQVSDLRQQVEVAWNPKSDWNYRNRCEGLLVLHLLPILDPWLISKCSQLN